MIIFSLGADYNSEKVLKAISFIAEKLGWICEIFDHDFHLTVEPYKLSGINKRIYLCADDGSISCKIIFAPIPVNSRCHELCFDVKADNLTNFEAFNNKNDTELLLKLFSAIRDYLVRDAWGDKDY